MPQARFQNAVLRGVTVALGEDLRRIDDERESFGGTAEQFERIKKTIGLNERRVAREGTTSADLCERAARDLFHRTHTDAGELDAIIFVTQTPDHFQPCNAAILHGRLGLNTSALAFDVNLGCSGWVVGMYLASLMVEAGGCSNVLLLAGDTMSRCVHPRDRSTAPLFGDAGSACLVQREPANSAFSLHTDGAGHRHIMIPAGAFRQPATSSPDIESKDEEGNIRSSHHLQMNGAEIFNFSIKVEPPAVREILEFAGADLASVDYAVFHQANKYIVGNIARRLKLPPEKVPCATVERFGNTSCASIPLTLCTELASPLLGGENRLVCSGFGVGLSWATCLLDLPPLLCASLAGD